LGWQGGPDSTTPPAAAAIADEPTPATPPAMAAPLPSTAFVSSIGVVAGLV